MDEALDDVGVATPLDVVVAAAVAPSHGLPIFVRHGDVASS